MRNLLTVAGAALLVAGLSACGQSSTEANDAAATDALNVVIKAGNSTLTEEPANDAAASEPVVRAPAAPAAEERPAAPPKPANVTPPATEPAPKAPKAPAPDPHAGHDMNNM